MPINANIEAISLSRCCYNALTDVYLFTLVSLVSAEKPKFEAISESGSCPLKRPSDIPFLLQLVISLIYLKEIEAFISEN